MKYIQTLTEKGKLKWHNSDAPEADGKFRDLSPKDLAAWLIKTRKGDMKKISGSLSQQVAFNQNDDKEYVKKMDKTRKEVYKQLDREDLLESVDMDDLKNAKERLSNPHTILDITYSITRRGDRFVRFDYENKYVRGKMVDSGPHFVKVFYGNDKDLKKISKELNMDLKESVLNEEDTWNDYPAAAKKNAQKAIDWKEKYGRDEVDAGTPVGWARAHQLAKGENLSTDTVKRMSAFNRHRKNSSIKPELKETPWKDRGYVAWLIWGGDEGVDWAIEKSKEIDAMKESIQMKHVTHLHEIKRSMISGTSGRTIDSLEDRKYELKKDVDGAKIGGFVNVKLPKGTIIYNLPGGVFADHFSLKNKYASRSSQGPKYFDTPTFKGIMITSMPDTLAAIEKNGKVLESVITEAKMPKKHIGNDEIVFLKTKEDSRGAHYNLYYKGHDIDKGGYRFGSEKELEDFADNYILSNQLYKKLRYEDSIPLPEAFVGPFVFNDKMSDDELKAMYSGALDGYAYYAKGMQYPKSDYKKAYQEIEKILKKRGVVVNEGTELKDVHQLIAHHRFDKDFKKLSSKDKEWVENDAKERGFTESSKSNTYIKTINEYFGTYEYDKFIKEFGKIKYPKHIGVKMKELVAGGFLDKVYNKEANYMSFWLNQMGDHKFNTDARKKEVGEVGYKLTDRYWHDLTGSTAFAIAAAEAALEVSKYVEDLVANKESVEPAYYMMKEYFKSHDMQTNRSRIFNMAVEKLEKWMKDNSIQTL